MVYLQALSTISLDGDTSAALDALGSELDQSRTEANRALAKAAALEAALSQQEAAVKWVFVTLY
jgi:predicted transcriptional regulator